MRLFWRAGLAQESSSRSGHTKWPHRSSRTSVRRPPTLLLAAKEVEDVVYCIGYLGDQVRNFVGNGNRWHLKCFYVDEGEHLLGTAGALRLALDQGILAECFSSLYGDFVLSIRLSDVMAAHRASSRSALMTVFRNGRKLGAQQCCIRRQSGHPLRKRLWPSS